jgi:hypothetical protein
MEVLIGIVALVAYALVGGFILAFSHHAIMWMDKEDKVGMFDPNYPGFTVVSAILWPLMLLVVLGGLTWKLFDGFWRWFFRTEKKK